MSAVGKLVGKVADGLGLLPDPPAPPVAPPPVPTMQTVAAAPAATPAGSAEAAAAEEERRRRANAGRASTVLAGDDVGAEASSASKLFLGAGGV